MKENTKIILIYGVIIAIILVLASLLFDGRSADKATYGDILSMIKEEKLKKDSEVVYSDSNKLTLTREDGKKFEFTFRDSYLFYERVLPLLEKMQSAGTIKLDIRQPESFPYWVMLIPFVLVILLLFFAYRFAFRSGSGGGGIGPGRIGGFGKARVKIETDQKKKVLFEDVAGADEEKEELKEVVDFLKNPVKFTDLGAKIPRGVLLVGPPGTGKTLLAKAVAGEAGVPFYSISGSDFVEMYVGVGASRVRDLFETAKKNSPSIVFIDEIDAVGRHRGAGLGGGHDEREQTLNQLLVEMDGFGSNEGVIIMAATNRPDILDPALLRPGRFDRPITVNYPDVKGREEILKVHSKGKPFEKEVDLKKIASTTVGFTGADLANLLNEAALLAARRSKRLIGNSELEEASLKVMMGPQKKSRVMTEKDKKITAYHEAGHAVVSKFLETADPVHQISIIGRGMAAGYTAYQPKEDKGHVSKKQMEEMIVSLLGGRVSEKLMLDDICSGASSDLERATEIARKMVTQYGMSDRLGPVVYGNTHEEVFLGRDFGSTQNYSESIAREIDEEIERIIKTAFDRAESILSENRDKLIFVAEYLMKNEIMDDEQFEQAMQDGEHTFEEIEAIRSSKAKKSLEENEKRREEERLAQELAEQAAQNAEKEDPPVEPPVEAPNDQTPGSPE
ncbi:MAG: ATP-dependent zinc metalloprotease FtsH [Clostridia bacterium]|nr:ATP-dependent zinc metalloprotease FtsH [Clostridia bacterium]